MKVCGVADITGASGAPNLGSIPSRPVYLRLIYLRLVYLKRLRVKMFHGFNRLFLRARRRRLSLAHLIVLVIILYLLLRIILLPLLWTLFLIVILIIILKVVLENV